MAVFPTTLTVAASSEPRVPTDGDTPNISGTSRFHWIMAAIVAMGFALCYWMDSAATSGPVRALPNLVPLGIMAGYAGWAGHKRVCDLISVFLWAVVVAMFSGPLVQIAGASRFPLIDEGLKRFDFVSTGEIVRWVQTHSAFWWISAVAYWSMLPLLIAGVFLPALFRRRQAAYRFILAGTLAALVTGTIFARFPAAGPWTVEHYQASKAQTQVSSQLARLKAHKVVGRLETGAIVSFPSFHTILAILCAFALWSIRWTRWPGVFVATAVCVSTVTSGWHYGIDVMGGIVVALACQGLARAAVARTQT